MVTTVLGSQIPLDAATIANWIAQNNLRAREQNLQQAQERGRLLLQSAQEGARQRSDRADTRLRSLELLASRSGPQDWVAYNNLLNGMGKPTGQAVDPTKYADDIVDSRFEQGQSGVDIAKFGPDVSPWAWPGLNTGYTQYRDGSDGVVHDTMYMTGEEKRPGQLGRTGEIVLNPTGAPQMVMNNEQARAMLQQMKGRMPAMRGGSGYKMNGYHAGSGYQAEPGDPFKDIPPGYSWEQWDNYMGGNHNVPYFEGTIPQPWTGNKAPYMPIGGIGDYPYGGDSRQRPLPDTGGFNYRGGSATFDESRPHDPYPKPGQQLPIGGVMYPGGSPTFDESRPHPIYQKPGTPLYPGGPIPMPIGGVNYRGGSPTFDESRTLPGGSYLGPGTAPYSPIDPGSRNQWNPYTGGVNYPGGSPTFDESRPHPIYPKPGQYPTYGMQPTNTYTKYDPATLANQPFYRKLTGQLPSNAWTGFGANLSNPGLGIYSAPQNINLQSFLKMAPTEQKMTQSLYEQGLAVDFGDMLEKARRGAPFGQSFGLARYGT